MTPIDILTRKLMDLGASTEIIVLVVEAVTSVTRDSHKASQQSRVTVTHVTPDDVRKAACLRKRKQREREKQQRLAAKEAEANDAAAASVTVTNVTRDKCDMSQDSPIYTSSSSQTLNKKEPSEEGSKHRKKDSSEKARATRIPVDWQLDQRHIDYAISKGVPPDRIPALGEKFKNHWLAASGKGAVSPNWFLKWCTWAMNDVEWNGKANGQQSNGHRAAQNTGPGATGQDAILAGMGRIADRIRARGDAERRERESSADGGSAKGDDTRLL